MRATPGVLLGFPRGAPRVIFFQVSASVILLANILHNSSVCALLIIEMGDYGNNKEMRICFIRAQMFLQFEKKLRILRSFLTSLTIFLHVMDHFLKSAKVWDRHIA